MLETSVQNLAVSNNQAIAFAANSLQKGCAITHVAGGTVINLNQPGVYKVDVNAYGVTSAAGAFGVQLAKNSIADPSATSSATTSAAADTAAVSFSKLISVGHSCKCINNKVALTINYIGSSGTIDLANINVVKIN